MQQTYYWWFLYYGQISKICWAISFTSCFVLVLLPSEFGLDSVFTLICEDLMNQFREVTQRIGWYQWIVEVY